MQKQKSSICSLAIPESSSYPIHATKDPGAQIRLKLEKCL